MREILFRGKAINRPPKGTYRTNYENGDWVYGLIDCHNDYETTMRNTNGISGIDVDPETLCEYTGLTDKNGKKIFEGDILDNNDGKPSYVCVFDSGRFGFYSIKEYKQSDFLYYDYDFVTDICTIYGNIYDNPKLLD